MTDATSQTPGPEEAGGGPSEADPTLAADQPTVEHAALGASTPTAAPPAPFAAPAIPADRPELRIGAAFAGGLTLALVLKRLAR